MQNLAPAGTWAWHLGQVAAAGIGLPQLLQNLAPAGTWAWHLGQATVAAPGDAVAPGWAAPGWPPAIAPWIICGIIMPIPAPRPRLAAPPPSPGFWAAASIPRAALKAMYCCMLPMAPMPARSSIIFWTSSGGVIAPIRKSTSSMPYLPKSSATRPLRPPESSS